MMLPLVTMAALSCTAELNPSLETADGKFAKITNTPENVCQESVLIQVTAGTDASALENGLCGLAAIERVFPDVPGKEEKAAAPKVSASMKKDELLAVAKEMGIEVSSKATKADIIAAIEAK